jgi:hypothetical protein
MRKRNVLTPNEKYVSQDDDRFVDAGISIVCVYNDPEVREQCLDRSIDAYAGRLEIDYIAVDNTGHDYSTAGAALNHGAEMARYDVVVFVHQDVPCIDRSPRSRWRSTNRREMGLARRERGHKPGRERRLPARSHTIDR